MTTHHLIDMFGKVALIKGSRLGRAKALGFAAAGANVVLTNRKVGGCRAVAEGIDAKEA